jgi:hypothetical protein
MEHKAKKVYLDCDTLCWGKVFLGKILQLYGNPHMGLTI